jgi:hypothetical protein
MNQNNQTRGWERLLGGCGLIAAVGVTAGFGLSSIGVGFAEPVSAADLTPGSATLQVEPMQDVFEAYRRDVEPMFSAPRGYPGTGEGGAACVSCHVWQTSLNFALSEMTQGQGGWSWTEEQSRENFEVVTRYLVDTSDPENSKLLLKPLAEVAGGSPHTGGDFWDSTQDPEYQAVLSWIRMLPAAQYPPLPAGPEVDFVFYRSCVLPRVLTVGNYGQMPCAACHDDEFAPPSAAGGMPSEIEARQGFAAIQRLIVPGDPERSRFLLKPLHPDGGGSYAHNGVRRWQSRSDPEWQMLAAWVRGELSGNSCPA